MTRSRETAPRRARAEGGPWAAMGAALRKEPAAPQGPSWVPSWGRGWALPQTGRGNVPALLTHRREGLERWAVVTCDETKTQRGARAGTLGSRAAVEREPKGLGGGETRRASFTEAEGRAPSPEVQSGARA